ncbi:MAG: exosortase [Roseibium album]|uniref:exosortase A n=1 Tax=Roseibium album TaxID=311410 RepID=UPI0032ECF4A9
MPYEALAQPGERSSLLRVILIGGALLATCLIFLDSVASLVAIWNSDGFRHGYLIPVITAFIFWRERHSVNEAQASPSWIGLGILIVSLWSWLVARLALLQVLEHLAILAVFHSLVVAVWGPRVYARAAFPLWYLCLAIPAGIEWIPWLMEFTAWSSTQLLQISGIPVLREGMYLSLPGGSFEVAESCSGFRYIFSGLALTALIAYLDVRSPVKRAAFLVVSVLCFVLLNSVRAALVMAIASATDMRYLADDHIAFGWALFTVLLIALYAAAQRCSDVQDGQLQVDVK